MVLANGLFPYQHFVKDPNCTAAAILHKAQPQALPLPWNRIYIHSRCAACELFLQSRTHFGFGPKPQEPKPKASQLPQTPHLMSFWALEFRGVGLGVPSPVSLHTCAAFEVSHLMLGAEGLLALQQLGVDPAVALEAINGASASIDRLRSVGPIQSGRWVGGWGGIRRSVDPIRTWFPQEWGSR